MGVPFEDLVFNPDATQEELQAAYDLMVAERRRIVSGLLDGSIELTPFDDDEGY
jgi:hypothetical protein